MHGSTGGGWKRTASTAAPRQPSTLQSEPEFRAMVHSMGFFEREVMFYSEFAADVPVAIPRCHFACIDRKDGWCLLLLEDLAPARSGSWVLGSSLEDLRVAVAGIARVHAARRRRALSTPSSGWPWKVSRRGEPESEIDRALDSFEQERDSHPDSDAHCCHRSPGAVRGSIG